MADQLLRSGLEVGYPVRDRGIDIIAYQEKNGPGFAARPIQMKAAARKNFSLDKKYEKIPNLLIAYVWNLEDSSSPIEIFALTYAEAFSVMEFRKHTLTPAWGKGNYVISNPGKYILNMIEKYRMTPERWRDRVVKGV